MFSPCPRHLCTARTKSMTRSSLDPRRTRHVSVLKSPVLSSLRSREVCRLTAWRFFFEIPRPINHCSKMLCGVQEYPDFSHAEAVDQILPAGRCLLCWLVRPRDYRRRVSASTCRSVRFRNSIQRGSRRSEIRSGCRYRVNCFQSCQMAYGTWTMKHRTTPSLLRTYERPATGSGSWSTPL